MGNSIVHLNSFTFIIDVDCLVKFLELKNLTDEESAILFNKICVGFLENFNKEEEYKKIGFSDVIFQNPNTFYSVVEEKIAVIIPNFKTIKNNLLISSLSIKSGHEEVAKKVCAIFGLFMKRMAMEWWEKEGRLVIVSKIFN